MLHGQPIIKIEILSLTYNICELYVKRHAAGTHQFLALMSQNCSTRYDIESFLSSSVWNMDQHPDIFPLFLIDGGE
jgi:hypothetical protein